MTDTALRIDGKARAAIILEQLGQWIAQLPADAPAPGLAVVRVGDDPASASYVRSKIARCGDVGIDSREFHLTEETTESDLLGLIERLNNDSGINGILVQLPLPAHMDEARVTHAIDPAKDVDGFHPHCVGQLVAGEDTFLPCTPKGIMTLLNDHFEGNLAGQHMVVVGRSNIVGKPMALLGTAADCTVTLVHSKSRDIQEHTRRADILVVAVGRAEMVDGGWVKPGAVVIDVGINRVERDGRYRLVGDVDTVNVAGVAEAVTPVPGGVGPMTIASLLQNTVRAYVRQRGLSDGPIC